MVAMLVRRRGGAGTRDAQRCFTRRWPGRPATLQSWMNVDRKCFIIDSFVVLTLFVTDLMARSGRNGNDNGIVWFGKTFDAGQDVARIFVAFPVSPAILTILRPVSVMPTLD
ncbi:hypothetical protein [Chromobacterium sp. CV08]|uniref:hypothetical protein n=1 Tax=Chromobacterium sp. CV08 TaxID=3133274 RepID=UPI003DA858A4